MLCFFLQDAARRFKLGEFRITLAVLALIGAQLSMSFRHGLGIYMDSYPPRSDRPGIHAAIRFCLKEGATAPYGFTPPIEAALAYHSRGRIRPRINPNPSELLKAGAILILRSPPDSDPRYESLLAALDSSRKPRPRELLRFELRSGRPG